MIPLHLQRMQMKTVRPSPTVFRIHTTLQQEKDVLSAAWDMKLWENPAVNEC